MKRDLDNHWTKWRTKRKKELIGQGIGRHDAKSIADSEAKGRQSAEALVGRAGALDAKLISKVRMDGSYSVYASVRPSQIPPHLLPRALAWEAMRGFSPSH